MLDWVYHRYGIRMAIVVFLWAVVHLLAFAYLWLVILTPTSVVQRVVETLPLVGATAPVVVTPVADTTAVVARGLEPRQVFELYVANAWRMEFFPFYTYVSPLANLGLDGLNMFRVDSALEYLLTYGQSTDLATSDLAVSSIATVVTSDSGRVSATASARSSRRSTSSASSSRSNSTAGSSSASSSARGSSRSVYRHFSRVSAHGDYAPTWENILARVPFELFEARAQALMPTFDFSLAHNHRCLVNAYAEFVGSFGSFGSLGLGARMFIPAMDAVMTGAVIELAQLERAAVEAASSSSSRGSGRALVEDEAAACGALIPYPYPRFVWVTPLGETALLLAGPSHFELTSMGREVIQNHPYRVTLTPLGQIALGVEIVEPQFFYRLDPNVLTVRNTLENLRGSSMAQFSEAGSFPLDEFLGAVHLYFPELRNDRELRALHAALARGEFLYMNVPAKFAHYQFMLNWITAPERTLVGQSTEDMYRFQFYTNMQMTLNEFEQGVRMTYPHMYTRVVQIPTGMRNPASIAQAMDNLALVKGVYATTRHPTFYTNPGNRMGDFVGLAAGWVTALEITGRRLAAEQSSGVFSHTAAAEQVMLPPREVPCRAVRKR